MYKIPTIFGIVLIFGFFFWDSISNDTSDPTKIVLSDKDTLGRNWDAIAEQKTASKIEAVEVIGVGGTVVTNLGIEDPLNPNIPTKNIYDDPFQRDKSSNYTTVPSPDGREIITGVENSDFEENPDDKYMSRHARDQSLEKR